MPPARSSFAKLRLTVCGEVVTQRSVDGRAHGDLDRIAVAVRVGDVVPRACGSVTPQPRRSRPPRTGVIGIARRLDLHVRDRVGEVDLEERRARRRRRTAPRARSCWAAGARRRAGRRWSARRGRSGAHAGAVSGEQENLRRKRSRRSPSRCYRPNPKRMSSRHFHRRRSIRLNAVSAPRSGSASPLLPRADPVRAARSRQSGARRAHSVVESSARSLPPIRGDRAGRSASVECSTAQSGAPEMDSYPQHTDGHPRRLCGTADSAPGRVGCRQAPCAMVPSCRPTTHPVLLHAGNTRKMDPSIQRHDHHSPSVACRMYS